MIVECLAVVRVTSDVARNTDQFRPNFVASAFGNKGVSGSEIFGYSSSPPYASLI